MDWARRDRERVPVLDHERCVRGPRRVLRQETIINGDLRRCPVDVRGRAAGIAGHALSRTMGA
eukprot:12328985-Alexandrium_andersonii.AAC.1